MFVFTRTLGGNSPSSAVGGVLSFQLLLIKHMLSTFQKKTVTCITYFRYFFTFEFLYMHVTCIYPLSAYILLFLEQVGTEIQIETGFWWVTNAIEHSIRCLKVLFCSVAENIFMVHLITK